jgi:hypothetical protein
LLAGEPRSRGGDLRGEEVTTASDPYLYTSPVTAARTATTEIFYDSALEVCGQQEP